MKKLHYTYPAAIHKDGDSDYGVSFHDFPGCISAGSTYEEALKMAQEAVGIHIQGMLEDGETIPSPTKIETLKALDDYKDADFSIISGFISIPMTEKTHRYNLSLYPSDVAFFDEFVSTNKNVKSRSQLIRAVASLIHEHPEFIEPYIVAEAVS